MSYTVHKVKRENWFGKDEWYISGDVGVSKCFKDRIPEYVILYLNSLNSKNNFEVVFLDNGYVLKFEIDSVDYSVNLSNSYSGLVLYILKANKHWIENNKSQVRTPEYTIAHIPYRYRISGPIGNSYWIYSHQYQDVGNVVNFLNNIPEDITSIHYFDQDKMMLVGYNDPRYIDLITKNPHLIDYMNKAIDHKRKGKTMSELKVTVEEKCSVKDHKLWISNDGLMIILLRQLVEHGLQQYIQGTIISTKMPHAVIGQNVETNINNFKPFYGKITLEA